MRNYFLQIRILFMYVGFLYEMFLKDGFSYLKKVINKFFLCNGFCRWRFRMQEYNDRKSCIKNVADI